MDKRVTYVPVPARAARLLMKAGLGRALGIAPELIDYFDHPSRYDCSHTQRALKGSDISCPPLPDYAPRLVSYMRRHADVRSEAMY
jgi:hypothetical protein